MHDLIGLGSLGPVLIPILALLIPIVSIIGSFWSQAHANSLKAEQRMTMLGRGIPLAEIEAVLSAPSSDREDSPASDPVRSLGRVRRVALVLISTGLGLMLFFFILTAILQLRPVLAGAAVGLIPFAIGIGFGVDYFLQKRDLARFGMALEVEPVTRD